MRMTYKGRNLGLALLLGIVLLLPAVTPLPSEAAQPSNKCTPLNHQYGFKRPRPDGRNWCSYDGASSEYLYWNYYPGTPGFNNVFDGPRAQQALDSMAYWASVLTKFRIIWSSGYWIDGVDAFLWVEEVDWTTPPGSNGYAALWQCSSQSSCVSRNPSDTNGNGTYNLMYVVHDED
jgi:hypothetical protein